MDAKKIKSRNAIDKRLKNLERDIDIPLDLDYMSILLKGKSPQYIVRFSAWARTTLDKDNHMENLVHALLSKFATDSLLGDSGYSEEFVKGQANGILFLYEEMDRLSNINAVTSDKTEQ